MALTYPPDEELSLRTQHSAFRPVFSRVVSIKIRASLRRLTQIFWGKTNDKHANKNYCIIYGVLNKLIMWFVLRIDIDDGPNVL